MPHSPLILLGRQKFRNLEYSPVSFRKQNVTHQHRRCQHNSLAAAIPLPSSIRENLLEAKPPETHIYHPHAQLDLNNSFCLFPPEVSEEKQRSPRQSLQGRSEDHTGGEGLGL